MRPDPRILLAPILALALACAGCESSLLVDAAARTFAQEKSCPGDRVQVKRAVFRPQELFDTGTPPAEVAADPGRLAVWQRNTSRDFKSHPDFTLVDLAGCNAHRTYFCHAEYGNDEFQPVCDPVDLDHPVLLVASSSATLSFYPMKPSAGQLLRQRLDAQR